MRGNDVHVADCTLCQGQIANPQPWHDDLCHINIRPGDDYGELPSIQCPHLAAPGSKLGICMRHLEAAHDAYVRMVNRTAPLN